MLPACFHPVVRDHFAARFGEPTAVQRAAFEHLPTGGHGLFAAPTGSGKTLAAFLSALDRLVRRAEDGTLGDALSVVYVSPLRALSHDIGENLEAPLADLSARLAARHPERVLARIRVAVRTGDTPARERRRALDRPPHVLVTTPESLYVLLTSERGAAMLQTVETVIVDEIHALVGSRRGDHLALSLARLDALAGRPVQRIGLSATQRPIDTVARYLTGGAPCHVHDAGQRRALDLALELPRSPLEAVMAAEVWDELHDRIAELAKEHRTTLVFVGNRRGCERTGLALANRLGDAAVGTHHGSLSREVRLGAEQRLRAGELRVLVATSSLELGIDVGDVELVVQLGSPGAISALLQRVGRARHQVYGTPKGRIFPLSTDDLVECIALLEAVARGELETLPDRRGTLDVLAQQLVAAVASSPLGCDEAFELVRAAEPYRELPRETFDAVVRMLAEGFDTARGRRGALLHLDAIHGRLRARRAARLTALTSGGTIPDLFDYDVVLEPTGLKVGTVHEDFAIESAPGDVFQLGSTSYRIARVVGQAVRVVDAHGVPPTLPFWVAEGKTRSDALTAAVARLRSRADAEFRSGEPVAATLASVPGVGEVAAEQAAHHLATARLALSRLPTDRTLVLERFFDEAGSAHMVVHGTLGARTNRAFALALRKRMCRAFNVELQAAAVEDAFLISLGPQHAFSLDEVVPWLRSTTVRDVATQAVLDRPVFETRFRWNATTALAVSRSMGGKRAPAPIQRIRSNDLLAVCFPDQVACLENVQGPRDVPDHPLVAATLRDCLEEWMDVPALERWLAAFEAGEIEIVTRELTEPSPLARNVASAKPWAFLDDAPLEERRARAVSMRRFMSVDDAAALGTLDPAVIARVRAEAAPPPRDAEELHDALLTQGFLPLDAAPAPLVGSLEAEGRVFRFSLAGRPCVGAKEREGLLRRGLPHADSGSRASFRRLELDATTAVARLVLERAFPLSAAELADELAVDVEAASACLSGLEAEGVALRGRFRPGATADEWCERGLLARIHRGTLQGLRAAVEPVEPNVFFDFLFERHGVTAATKRRGPDGLDAALETLLEFEVPAFSLEAELLPARVVDYQARDLDALGLAGRVAWLRFARGGARPGHARRLPVRLVRPERLDTMGHAPDEATLGSRASAALAVLRERGPRFASELGRAVGLLDAELEATLLELVSTGHARSDAFAGLRALYGGVRDRPTSASASRGVGGRWSAVESSTSDDLGARVDVLLARYGVVLRRCVEREPGAPPFRELLPELRRREARGELRGGHFVAGVSGEQYATDATLTALRAHRRSGPSSGLVALSGLDPLNLVGYLTHDERVPHLAGHRVLFENGAPVGAFVGTPKTLRPSLPLTESQRAALLGRRVA